MGVQKAFGFTVRCDQEWVVEDDGPESDPIQCTNTLLVITPSHSEGKYGGEFVIHDAKKNGYLYDRAGKQFACPECFKKLEALGKVGVEPQK